ANPGAIERGKFAEYRAAGLTRVSLGAQSFDSRRLAALGRIHSPDETRRAAAELHAAGLDNFNLDLMYALPGQDVAAAIREAGANVKVSFPASGTVGRALLLREQRRYLASVPAVIARQEVASHELPFEFMLNALRLVRGFDTATFSERTGLDWAVVAGPMEA